MSTLHGVVDMPADEYHKHPALSSSGARKLLPPSCPALFKHDRDNPPAPTEEFSFGHLYHKLVLGAGAEIVVIDAENWRTKDAREQRAAAHAEGKIPALAEEYMRAKAMVTATMAHPLAARLLKGDPERSERALFWTDEETGVPCRAMLDRFPSPRVATDVKTCVSAAPAEIERAVWKFGYHVQDAWYRAGLKALGIHDNPGMAFVFVEKNPPHLVNVVQLNPLALEAGAHYARQARLIFAECTESGVWPGWGDDIQMVELPAYAQNQYFSEVGK